MTQRRVSDLMGGKTTLFDLDTLVIVSITAGLHIEMKVLAPDDSDMTPPRKPQKL
ncbi:XRE family transcriptional regulator [Cupriavidus metallidurans]|uniref:XRE family transcriptional regulator n=1 Tax=Cupriavidus metallidurans TaxID=119219 RepID=UPI001CCAC9E7|nr:XRE family transcriptional regulator [Cupriavidus metallidurans]